FLFITIGALALGGAVFIPSMLAGGPKKPEGPTIMPPKINRQLLVPPGSHMKGDPNAPFTIVEFSDFQCSHCKDAYPRMEQMIQQYKPRLNFVYHHYRAAPGHRHSFALGWAAEAAGMQGKFFEMAERIFNNQDH